ncbi:MAG: glycosyltransferase [Xanthomonadales bacterium]|nr:glycosyltransferase [Xanthomonadales bacterium]
MQILLITQEPPLASDAIATGNAIRTAQLVGALRRAGHGISQTWLDNAEGRQQNLHTHAFRNRDELQATIVRQQPDAILVSYWELLELLPFDLRQPVILDFVAPRPLELLYEHPERVKAELQRLQSNLSKCDVLLTGNQSQRDLLWFTLLQSGFDLRGRAPVLVVPLSAEPAGRPESDPKVDGWTLVSGGVHWPWRKSDDYWHAIQDMKGDGESNTPRLVLFGGPYRWQEKNPQDSKTAPVGDTGNETSMGLESGDQYQTQGLAPYAHFSRFLLESAHIGLELAEANIERSFSQSFRSLEFLRHGLPLICNDYLPIAGLVRQYEAGWTVKGPDEIADRLREIMKSPDEWKNRSENALRLVEEVLNPDKTVKPLLDWLETPAKAPRLPVLSEQPAAVVLGTPPWPERLKRQARLLRRVGLSRLFRTGKTAIPGDSILIVTRSDLFPADHGGAVKIVETARGLSLHGRKVGIVSDDRRHWWLFENGRKQLCRLPFWLRLLSLPHSLTRLLHFSKELPESNSFLYLPLTDNSFFWHCLYAARKLNAGILQAEFPAYAKPCIEAREILNAAVVLVEHNVEYARLKAQVAELSDQQFRNLRAIEIDLCNRSDAVVCVSDNDRQQLLRDGVKPELLNTIPHGFNPEPYKLPAQDSLRKRFGLPDNAVLIAFHGTFSYPPNRDALQVFADILLPQLASSRYSFHVVAIGRNPPAESIHPNIHFTGSVEEVGPWLKACDMAVIPLREGGGTRMKIIDCFAAGLPVISTSKGIEGIPVVNGREAIVCNEWLSMTNNIMELAGSKELRYKLSSAALDFTSEMDWKSLGERYLDIYSAVRRAPK